MTLQHIPWGDDPSFQWDEFNEEEVANHHVTPDEVESCFEDVIWVAPHNRAKSEPERYGDRFRVRGITFGGRQLLIIVQYIGGNLIRPVTAWDND